MRRLTDKELRGTTWGYLTIVRAGIILFSGSQQKHHVRARCSCGSVSLYSLTNLRSGNTTRCQSCYRKNHASTLRHGHARRGKVTSEYRAWQGMIRRCTNPSNAKFPDYGGRGIRVCSEWLHSFDSFIHYIGPKPNPKLSLDRIDPNGDYEPGNVRWATAYTQRHNQRRNTGDYG